MDGDQETVRAVVGELVAVALESFVLTFPHAEAIVRLSAPVFQVLNENFVAGVITADALQHDLTLAVIHRGFGLAGLLSFTQYLIFRL